MFTVAGEHLTLRMRKLAFASMLKQEMAWFDNPKNNTGALCSRLSADAAAIQGVSFFLFVFSLFKVKALVVIETYLHTLDFNFSNVNFLTDFVLIE